MAALNPAALERGLSANDVLRAAAGPVGGRGGGKADVAQGGGTDPAGIPAALQAGEQAVAAATGKVSSVPGLRAHEPRGHRSGRRTAPRAAGGAARPGRGRDRASRPTTRRRRSTSAEGFPPVSNETTEIDLSAAAGRST